MRRTIKAISAGRKSLPLERILELGKRVEAWGRRAHPVYDALGFEGYTSDIRVEVWQEAGWDWGNYANTGIAAYSGDVCLGSYVRRGPEHPRSPKVRGSAEIEQFYEQVKKEYASGKRLSKRQRREIEERKVQAALGHVPGL